MHGFRIHFQWSTPRWAAGGEFRRENRAFRQRDFITPGTLHPASDAAVGGDKLDGVRAYQPRARFTAIARNSFAASKSFSRPMASLAEIKSGREITRQSRPKSGISIAVRCNRS
jgi:hypothetical protein